MAAAVQNLRGKYNETHTAVVSMLRRYHTLTEHIAQVESYVNHTVVYKRYSELKGDKQDSYFDKHRAEILAFSTAHEYITHNLNGYTQIPLNEWKRELAELTVQRDVLLAESDKLSNELRSAEVIKRNAKKVMTVYTPKQNRVRDVAL